MMIGYTCPTEIDPLDAARTKWRIHLRSLYAKPSRCPSHDECPDNAIARAEAYAAYAASELDYYLGNLDFVIGPNLFATHPCERCRAPLILAATAYHGSETTNPHSKAGVLSPPTESCSASDLLT